MSGCSQAPDRGHQLPDALIYEHHGLTKEEIGIVEASFARLRRSSRKDQPAIPASKSERGKEKGMVTVLEEGMKNVVLHDLLFLKSTI
jgi:hypothetical protein